ncbi:MAG: hypothetical protein PHP98_07555 [Kiritimatiellae bacterium]|nr:hypothetical protein [Kiritimatiellia bacterium]
MGASNHAFQRTAAKPTAVESNRCGRSKKIIAIGWRILYFEHMSTRREPIVVSLYQIGKLDVLPEVQNSVVLANQTQQAFRFVFKNDAFPLPETLRLRNGGYDVESAVRSLIRRCRGRVGAPAFFITSQPYTDQASQEDPDGLFFSGLVVAEELGVISTHLWQKLPGARRIQPYILFCLSSIAFDICAGISVHDETRGCPFDYCDKPSDIDKAFDASGLCQECSRHMNRALRTGRATIEQAGAAERLLNRAAGKKQAFVAMPFTPDMKSVFKTIRRTLQGHGWKVVRVDETAYPRSITDAVIHSILASNLVIADITGGNPNVFYELGWAHATDQDVLLLTQEEKIPFDVTTERAIIYTLGTKGIARLMRQLLQAIKRD